MAAQQAAVRIDPTGQEAQLQAARPSKAEAMAQNPQGVNRVPQAATVEQDPIPTIEVLLAGYERGGRAQVLQRLDITKKLTPTMVQNRIRGLGLSPAKTAQLNAHAEELIGRLTRRAPKTEIEALKRRLEDLCCSWGLRANLLATCSDYSILARLVACAVTMEQ